MEQSHNPLARAFLDAFVATAVDFFKELWFRNKSQLCNGAIHRIIDIDVIHLDYFSRYGM